MFVPKLSLQMKHLFLELLFLESVPNIGLELVDFERLGEVVVSPEAKSLYRSFRRRIGRHHDDRRARLRLLHVAQNLDPAHVGHFDVGDHEVERILIDELRRRLARIGQGDSMPVFPQCYLEKLAHGLFVINDKNAAQPIILRSIGKRTEISVPFEATVST